MPPLTCTPPFLANHPAPQEWQDRVHRLDPDLWVAWNPFHRAGPSWVIVKHHGRIDNAVNIVGLESRASWQNLWQACRTGWCIVAAVLTPDEKPCDLGDRHIAAASEWLGNTRPRSDPEKGEEEIEKTAADGKVVRKQASDALLREAFEATREDEKTSNIVGKPYKSSVILPTAGDVAAFS